MSKRKIFLITILSILILLVIIPHSLAQEQYKRILPTTSFLLNTIRAPIAWEITKGENTKIAIICDKTKAQKTLELTKSIAPDSKVSVYQIKENASVEEEVLNAIKQAAKEKSDVIVLMKNKFKFYEKISKEITKVIKKGVPVIVPAYESSFKSDKSRKDINKFLNKIESAGAILAGATDKFNEIASISYWEDVNISVFSLLCVGEKKYLKEDLSIPALTVGATAVLLKAKNHKYTPAEIKKIIINSAHNAYVWNCEYEFEYKSQKYKKEHAIIYSLLKEPPKLHDPPMKKIKKYYSYKILDTGSALNPKWKTNWHINAINADCLQKLATGKGITVAILDWNFKESDPSLKERVVFPGCVVPGEKAFSEVPEHGTWMAQALVEIAPDVKIMPVMIVPPEDPDAKLFDDYRIKGIYYAIEHKADIISCSHQPVAKEKTEEFEKAINKAIDAGIIIAFIHYDGNNPDVVVPAPIEFASLESKNRIFILGTNYWGESNITWGFSQTAPTVSGVIALMKELNPKLTVSEIKKQLLEAGTLTQGDNKAKILDCIKLKVRP